MVSRYVILAMLLLMSLGLLAQRDSSVNIRMQKNNTFRSTRIKVTKKMKITFVTDSGKANYSGRAFKYKFPYLYFKRPNDTLIVDVRTIEELRCTAENYMFNFLGVVYPLGALSGKLIDKASSYDNMGQRLGFFLPALLPLPLMYVLIDNAFRNYNTKTVWSFTQ
jgi:hypothetical protein